jgi:HAE1 family hydrophobic/amphiphilic exporter-1
MNLPELSIRRHVLAYMLSGVLVLFGLISFLRIGVDRYPDIDFPLVSVATALPGADPEIVNSSITKVIESAVNSVPGIEHVESTSSPGVSLVSIKFAMEKDLGTAFNEVQAKVNQVLNKLPREAKPPVVAKVEIGATPIMQLALQGDRTPQQLNQYARNVIKKRLETVNGVGEIRLGGERERTLRVNLNPERMAGLGVTVQDVVRAFETEHVRLPGGFLVGGKQEDLIKLDLEFHSARELERMIVAYPGGAPIRLSDIAVVEDGLADNRQLARYQGKPAVGIGVIKVSGSNAVAVADEVERRLNQEIIPQLPPGMTLAVASNDANLIREIVAALEEHIVTGTLFTALVVWLFLINLRSTLIVAVAIPVSLLGAVAVMYFAGFTFNTMTLLGLLLLIGVVVDDAIVVLENIYRHREHLDPDPVSAALNGTREVGFAVMAATLTLVAIFVPVIFMGGIIGRFFQSFAVVVSAGVLVSLFVALTLTPMLCARYLQVAPSHGRAYRFLERGFQAMDAAYRSLLERALRFRWTVVAITVMVVAGCGWFFTQLGGDFMPVQDEGRFLVNFKTPLGTGIEYADEKLRRIETVLARHPEIAGAFSAIGTDQAGQVNKGFVDVRMAPWGERSITQQQLIDKLGGELAAIPGVEAFPSPLSIIGGQRGEPLQFVLAGPDLNQVARLAHALNRQLARDPGMGRVDLELQLDLPQLETALSRERINSLGLSTRDVAQAVNVLAGGLDIARFNDRSGDAERYDIRLKAAEGALQQPEDLSRIYLRAGNGELVRLDNLVRLDRRLGPAIISGFDLRYAAKFYSTPTATLSDAVARVERAAAPLLLPGYTVQMVGRAEEFGKTMGYMLFAFVTSILLVYMVLASQFNSFLQPLVVMVAQPLAVVGGGAALWLAGHTLNIFSMVGLVLLVGLVAKNSILLVDLTNQLRQKGAVIDTALLEACPLRLRPVLMTSLTVILALLPAALGVGAGAATTGPMAVAVIGGMISSTLLTLVVVPAVYSLVEHGAARVQMNRTAREHQE